VLSRNEEDNVGDKEKHSTFGMLTSKYVEGVSTLVLQIQSEVGTVMKALLTEALSDESEAAKAKAIAKEIEDAQTKTQKELHSAVQTLQSLSSELHKLARAKKTL
jgi:hypothetical protein